MPYIKIKGRIEPITVTGEVARKIKDRWVGNEAKGIKKAERSDVLDLGEWCGEYGQIKEIDTKVESARAPEKPDPSIAEAQAQNEQFKKLPPEEKAKNIDRFVIYYGLRNGWKEPSQETLKKVYELQLEYFSKYQDAYNLPKGLYEKLLTEPK